MGFHFQNWMSNYRSKEKRTSEKSVTNEKPVTFTKKKRLTGYDVFKRGYLTGVYLCYK